MLVEYVGGSVAGKVMPGPVVCLLLRGGFVAEVGDVTVDVVNLPVAVDVDVATVVVAEVVLVINGAVVAAAAVVVNDDDDGEGGFASETLDVGIDFSSILSELEFSEDDGLEAFDVLEETLSAFSPFVTSFVTSFTSFVTSFATSFLLSTLGLSVFFPGKVIARFLSRPFSRLSLSGTLHASRCPKVDQRHKGASVTPL